MWLRIARLLSSSILFMGEPALNMAIHSVGGGIGGWDLDYEWVTPLVRALNLGHHETWDGQSSLPFFSQCALRS